MTREERRSISYDLLGELVHTASDEQLIETYEDTYYLIHASMGGLRESLVFYACERELLNRGYEIRPRPPELVRAAGEEVA